VSVTLEPKEQQLSVRRPFRDAVLAPPIGFAAALQFLTIVPRLVRRPFAPAELGRAVGWFPLVGVLLGGVLTAINLGLVLLFPPAVVAAVMLVAWVVFTGALHLDGFLDSCDGLWGGQTPEARLRIMRDERVGAFAVIGGVLLVLVKYACLASLAERIGALFLAPTLGRWAMTASVIIFPYARAEGLGRDMKDHARWRALILGSVTAVAAAVLAAAWLGLIALAVVTVMIGVLAFAVLRRLPGFTGDLYGALCELVEMATLLVFVAGESR
jgi:adenosylcobinamide-GDP ribazoletransferase